MSDSGHNNSGGESPKDWTETQSNQITGLYKSLHGKYQEEANKKLFGGPQLPYEDAHHILTGLLEAQEHGKGGLENTVNAHSKILTPWMDLGVIAASVGLAAVASPVIGAIAGSVYLMSKFYSYKTKPAHP